jgi:RNA polymerase sigma-70 factor (ECF subfamily)
MDTVDCGVATPNGLQETVLEDRELVQKLLAKDEQAYRYFYQTYQERIYRASVCLLGYQDPDAEDITQDVFLAALQQLPQFEFRSSLYHWLNRICMYLCFERVRKRRRLVVGLEGDLEAAARSAFPGPGNPGPDEKEKQEMLQLIEDQKQRMGDPCKSLLDLREAQQKSYAQIAVSLKVPIGTVMSRLARCKETLKNLVLKALKELPHGG